MKCPSCMLLLVTLGVGFAVGCSTPCEQATRHIDRCLASLCEAPGNADNVYCAEADDTSAPECAGEAERYAREFLEMSCEELAVDMRFDEFAGILPGPTRTPPSAGQGPCAATVYRLDGALTGRHLYSYTDAPGATCRGLPRFGGGCPTLDDFFQATYVGDEVAALVTRTEVHMYDDTGQLESSETRDHRWEVWRMHDHRYYAEFDVWRSDYSSPSDEFGGGSFGSSAPPSADTFTPPIVTQNSDGTLASYQEDADESRYVFIYDCSAF